MRLPKLLLDADIGTCLKVLEYAQSGDRPLLIDAGDIVALEPVGACLLANAARIAATAGSKLTIDRMPDRLRQLFDRMNTPIDWGIEAPDRRSLPGLPQAPTLAMQVTTAASANAAANQLAEHITSFVPSDMRAAILQDNYGRRFHHAVEPALGHVLSELLDNVFSHARTQAFPEPYAWVAAQYYPTGDLMRVAVVDDGCGLLGSMQGYTEGVPRNHFEAAQLAFTPFISSKSAPSIYADRRHMGMGLAVCREICRKLDGRIYSASGNAQVINPGIERRETRSVVRFFQGTVISLEFHRQAATLRTVSEALETYSKAPRVDVRFD